MRRAWNVLVAGVDFLPRPPAPARPAGLAWLWRRRGGATTDDGAGDAAARPLLAQTPQDGGELGFARLVDPVGGRPLRPRPEAHVQGRLDAEAEATRRARQLHRGEAEVEEDAVDRREAALAADGLYLPEVALDDVDGVAEAGETLARQGHGLRVGVEAAGGAAGRGRIEDRLGVAAAAHRAVDVAPARPHVEDSDGLTRHHGLVADGGVGHRRHSDPSVPR